MQTAQALSGAALGASTLGVDTHIEHNHSSHRGQDSQGGQTTFSLDAAATFVRDYPWYAAGVAIGAGVLIGLLLPKK